MKDRTIPLLRGGKREDAIIAQIHGGEQSLTQPGKNAGDFWGWSRDGKGREGLQSVKERRGQAQDRRPRRKKAQRNRDKEKEIGGGEVPPDHSPRRQK